jgi:hypothetical protein
MGSFPFNRHTPPAAMFQMIDFSAGVSWQPDGDVGRHKRDCEPDCERSGIVVPGPVTWTFASVALALSRPQYVHVIPQHDYSHTDHNNALRWTWLLFLLHRNWGVCQWRSLWQSDPALSSVCWKSALQPYYPYAFAPGYGKCLFRIKKKIRNANKWHKV